jgi:hypothetical protein
VNSRLGVQDPTRHGTHRPASSILYRARSLDHFQVRRSAYQTVHPSVVDELIPASAGIVEVAATGPWARCGITYGVRLDNELAADTVHR